MRPFARQLAQRIAALVRIPAVLLVLIVGAGLGTALTRLPLFEVPGFELASAMTAILAIACAAFGILAARRERVLLRAPAGPEPGAAASPRVAALLAFAAAATLGIAMLVPPVLAALLGTALRTPCSPWAGLGFFGVLPVPTALLGAALGAAAGFATRRARSAGLLVAVIALIGLVLSIWPLYAGPQVFALNHLFGYFPGPLYDAALPIDARLLAYRALTLCWAGLILAATSSSLDASGRLRRPRPGAWTATAMVLLAGALVLGRIFQFELGLETNSKRLARELAGRTETEHFILHYPRTKPPEEVLRLERDLEFRYDQVTRFLGAAPQGKIEAWFHRSPEEKRRLVGAAETNYAKPWRLEFHVQDAPFPHRIARHEMAHVIAGAFGSPLLRVSARLIVGVNIGLVEGIAVAADDRADELTLHQWAAAMRRIGLAPDLRRIVGPAGFYGQAPSRAYTLSGSFLRFLGEHHGPESLRRLYPAGDFKAAFGSELDTLASQWEAFLDAIPLSDRDLHLAEVRFERGSLFQQPCARELAALREEADGLWNAEPELALRLYERCEELDPGNPAHLRAQARVLRARRDLPGARALLEQVLALPSLTVGARALTLLDVGDLAWEQGDLEPARECFAQALGLGRDRTTDRSAVVRLEALAAAEGADILRAYFTREADTPELLALQEFALRQPTNATARYLVGRQLLQRGAPRAAVAWLAQARALAPSAPEVEAENLRLLVQASYLAGDCDGALEAARQLEEGPRAADQAFAADWRERCGFERRAWGGPLASKR